MRLRCERDITCSSIRWKGNAGDVKPLRTWNARIAQLMLQIWGPGSFNPWCKGTGTRISRHSNYSFSSVSWLKTFDWILWIQRICIWTYTDSTLVDVKWYRLHVPSIEHHVWAHLWGLWYLGGLYQLRDRIRITILVIHSDQDQIGSFWRWGWM